MANGSAGNMTNFNSATRQSWLQCNAIPYTAGVPNSQQLLQIGFLSRIILPITVNFTTSNAGTYANSTSDLPTPWGFVTRVRVFTNEGQELFNTSGYGAYLHESTCRTALDPRNPVASFNSVNTAAGIYSIPTSYTTSTTYNIRFYLYLDIAWEQSNLAGLIFLQNPTNRISLEVTYGTGANLITASGGGAVTINSVTCVPLMEVFNLPLNASNWPAINYAHQVIEDSNVSIVGNGDFSYKPLLGNVYLSVINNFNNNGTNMSPGDFSLLRIQYQGTQNSYSMSPTNQTIMQRNRYSHDMPDGVFVHDFRLGTGILEAGNIRDVVNTGQLTDFQIISTISAAITQPAYMRGIREMLAPLVSSNGQ